MAQLNNSILVIHVAIGWKRGWIRNSVQLAGNSADSPELGTGAGGRNWAQIWDGLEQPKGNRATPLPPVKSSRFKNSLSKPRPKAKRPLLRQPSRRQQASLAALLPQALYHPQQKTSHLQNRVDLYNASGSHGCAPLEGTFV